MADDPVPRIAKILTTLDGTLRRRLARLGIGEPNHIIMARASNGAAVIRSNCGPELLREMAAILIEIADQAQEPGQGKPH